MIDVENLRLLHGRAGAVSFSMSNETMVFDFKRFLLGGSGEKRTTTTTMKENYRKEEI